jgi:hypothetical protein
MHQISDHAASFPSVFLSGTAVLCGTEIRSTSPQLSRRYLSQRLVGYARQSDHPLIPTICLRAAAEARTMLIVPAIPLLWPRFSRATCIITDDHCSWISEVLSHRVRQHHRQRLHLRARW